MARGTCDVAVKPLALLVILATLSVGGVWASSERSHVNAKDAICIALDALYEANKGDFPRNFEIKVDEDNRSYVVHIIPLPLIEEKEGGQYTTVGGSYRIFVDKTTGAVTKRVMDQ